MNRDFDFPNNRLERTLDAIDRKLQYMDLLEKKVDMLEKCVSNMQHMFELFTRMGVAKKRHNKSDAQNLFDSSAEEEEEEEESNNTKTIISNSRKNRKDARNVHVRGAML
jgi:hypothetical protein